MESSPWASPDSRGGIAPEPAPPAGRPEGQEEIESRVPAQTVVTVPTPAALAGEPDTEQSLAQWPTREMMAGRTVRAHREPARPKAEPARRAASVFGLTSLVLFTLLAAFFAWVSAGPLWLAVGHGEHGSAAVTECVGAGVSRRCVGDFTAADGTVTERVALYGVPTGAADTSLPARMAGSHGDTAYVGEALRGLHLRWAVGVGLCLLCGAGIALTSGAVRFTDRRARRAAVAVSLAAPLLLLVGFLAAAY